MQEVQSKGRAGVEERIAKAVAEWDTLPDSALVPRQVVERLWSVCPATIWNRVKKGTLPAPAVKGRWLVGDLRAAQTR